MSLGRCGRRSLTRSCRRGHRPVPDRRRVDRTARTAPESHSGDQRARAAPWPDRRAPDDVETPLSGLLGTAARHSARDPGAGGHARPAQRDKRRPGEHDLLSVHMNTPGDGQRTTGSRSHRAGARTCGWMPCAWADTRADISEAVWRQGAVRPLVDVQVVATTRYAAVRGDPSPTHRRCATASTAAASAMTATVAAAKTRGKRSFGPTRGGGGRWWPRRQPQAQPCIVRRGRPTIGSIGQEETAAPPPTASRLRLRGRATNTREQIAGGGPSRAGGDPGCTAGPRGRARRRDDVARP